MVLGLCSSFAVVPAWSLLSGHPSRGRLAHPAGRSGQGTVPQGASNPLSVAAMLVSNAAWSAVSTVGVDPSPATTTKPAVSSVPASHLVASPPRASAKTVAPGVPAPVPVVPVPTSRGSTLGAEHGVASWLDIPAGTCADNGAPMGATLTVTNGAGVSVTCVVISRGPFVTGRVIDLAASTFSHLGPLARGLVSVTVTW